MNIAVKRKERQLTQEELAKAMGVDRTTVTKWETKENLPRVEMLIKLSGFFKCSIDDLLGINAELEQTGSAVESA